jgi:hypothetical protein
VADTADFILCDALMKHPKAKTLQITLAGTGCLTGLRVRPFRDVSPEDLRARAKEFGLPLLETSDYVAISQYSVVTDDTTYLVTRHLMHHP